MAWHWPCHKPLSEPMMDCLLKHICVTRPQWVHFVLSCRVTHICHREPGHHLFGPWASMLRQAITRNYDNLLLIVPSEVHLNQRLIFMHLRKYRLWHDGFFVSALMSKNLQTSLLIIKWDNASRTGAITHLGNEYNVHIASVSSVLYVGTIKHHLLRNGVC